MTYVGKPIGLRNFTWFPLTADPADDTATYGTALPLARAIEATITPQFAEALLESEDGIEDDLRQASSYEVVIHANQLTHAVRAALLGHTVSDDGGLIIGGTDTPATGAFAFRTLLSKEAGGDDLYEYHVYYKGRFSEFPETYKTTTKDGVTFQTASGIRGIFTKRDSDGQVAYRLREDEAEDGADTAIGAWFTAPQVGAVTNGA